MKTCKTILTFILMFTGYLCSDYESVTEMVPTKGLVTEMVPTKGLVTETVPARGLVTEMVPTKGLSPPLQNATQASTHHSEQEETPSNSSPPARHLSSIVVAGISICLVFLFIIIITVFWYAQKNSKESSAEMNSVLSTEPGVYLKNISMNENHPEWPFERA